MPRLVESAESNGVKWVPMAALVLETDAGIRRMAAETIR